MSEKYPYQDGELIGQSAARANSGKPQLSYLLTFVGFSPDGEFHAGDSGFDPALGRLVLLSKWYRVGVRDSEECWDKRLAVAIQQARRELGLEAFTIGIARVAEFGANKYARGNYLLGRGWSDTCDSLVRHALHLSADLETGELTEDEDGLDKDSGLPHAWHEAWNWAFLMHCVCTMPERDDRVRAPEGGK